MEARRFLALDLGAESGRAVLGTLEGGRLHTRELRRFPNGMVRIRGHWHWNVFRLFEEIKAALRDCAAQGVKLDGLAVDTWGVDFCLVASDGSILGLPYTYRDSRTVEAMAELGKRIAHDQLYQWTGIQHISVNSIYQLYAYVLEQSPLLGIARALLFMPDLFNYLLTGVKRTEFTFATTSQLYNPVRGDWEAELFALLGVPRDIMQEIVPPGTVLGPLSSDVAQEAGLGPIPVISTASHDTAAAVAAVPAEGEEWAYISSGTWSLMGVEKRAPLITEQSAALNLTNEGGVGGTFRVLKNITGLWLVQQCQRAWARERAYSYAELVQLAAAAPPCGALIDPGANAFMNPPDMPETIRQACRETGQEPPASVGPMTRCILESLALSYRAVLEELRQVYGRPIRTLHIVGGGAQNELLNQLTAEATGLPVVAGPVEAAAVGNLLVQALAVGELSSPAEIRDVVRASFPLQRYEPHGVEQWEEAYARFRALQDLRDWVQRGVDFARALPPK
jgi:rhamnulokinase